MDGGELFTEESRVVAGLSWPGERSGLTEEVEVAQDESVGGREFVKVVKELRGMLGKESNLASDVSTLQ